MMMKPGWKTTEFWLTTAAMVLGAVLASGVFADGGQALRIVGAAIAVLSKLGYTAARAKVKTEL